MRAGRILQALVLAIAIVPVVAAMSNPGGVFLACSLPVAFVFAFILSRLQRRSSDNADAQHVWIPVVLSSAAVAVGLALSLTAGGSAPSGSFEIFAFVATTSILGLFLASALRRCFAVSDEEKEPFPEALAAREVLTERASGSPHFWLLLAGFAGGVFLGDTGSDVHSFTFGERSTPVELSLIPLLVGGGMVVGFRVSLVLFLSGIVGLFLLEQIPSSGINSQSAWSVAILGGAVVGILFRKRQRIVEGLRTQELPYRVRFEIGGEGTRVEDMSQPADREIPPRTCLVFAAVLCLASAFVFPETGVEFSLSSRLILACTIAVLGVAIAVMVAGITMRGGAMLLPLLLAALVGSDMGGGFLGLASVLLMVSVGTSLQDYRTGYLLGAAPRSIALAKTAGFLIAAGAVVLFLPPITMPVVASNLPDMVSLPLLVGGAVGAGLECLGLPGILLGLGVWLPLAVTLSLLAGSVGGLGIGAAFAARSGSSPQTASRMLGASVISGVFLVEVVPFLFSLFN